jgi:hypothetical protein
MKYKISTDVLEQVAQEVTAKNLTAEESIQLAQNLLAEHYPKLINPKRRVWIGSRAGGILGKMILLHASFNEYLIIFGCPAGSNGFSGRYNFMEIWDFFLTGETITCDLENNQTEPMRYQPGDVGYMAKGDALTCEIKAGSWMIEYGRGAVITALPFALADSIISSVELRSLWLTVKEYTLCILKSFRA